MAAQQVRVTVPADSVAVGERFEIGVAVEHGRSTRVAFPDVPPPEQAGVDPSAVFGDAEVIAARRFPPTDTPSGARVDSVVFTATTFALDAARLGPIPVALVAGTGAAADTVALDVPTRVLPVRSVVPDSLTTPLPLEPPLGFPEPLPLWVALVIVALLAGLALWLWRTRRQRIGLPAPVLPPREEALVRLDALAVPDRSAPDAVPTYYAALADTLRTYLARALTVPAHEQTTRELLRTLETHPDVDEATRVRLGVVLRRADLAKFARVTPDVETQDADRATVRAGVETVAAQIEARLKAEAAASGSESGREAPTKAGPRHPA
ncbi:MAG: DUF4381 family protein [Bacteroidota bacterium]